MPNPCSYCSSQQKQCRFDLRYSKCAECTRRGKPCDFSVSRTEFDALREQRRLLKTQLAAAVAEQQRVMKEHMKVQMQMQKKVFQLWQKLQVAESKESGAFEKELALLEAQELPEAPTFDADEPFLVDFPADGEPSSLTPGQWASILGEPFEPWTMGPDGDLLPGGNPLSTG